MYQCDIKYGLDRGRESDHLAENMISDIRPSVGRPRINREQMPARLAAGTLARIDAVLAEKEKRSDFIREAINRELERRERLAD
jgi:hypothetical protein